MLAATAFTAPAAFYVKLHTADPGSAGTTAAAAGDTVRKAVTWSSASAGSKAMSSMSGSWTNGGTSETLTHVSFWDNVSAGVFLGSAALSSSQAWNTSKVYALTALTIAFTPIAA
jgi:hypothetical protein